MEGEDGTGVDESSYCGTVETTLSQINGPTMVGSLRAS